MSCCELQSHAALGWYALKVLKRYQATITRQELKQEKLIELQALSCKLYLQIITKLPCHHCILCIKQREVVLANQIKRDTVWGFRDQPILS